MACAISVAIALLTSGCSTLLYYPYQGFAVEPAKMKTRPLDVVIEAEDGVRLHAWYFKAPARPAKGTILHFHGNAQNISTHFFNLYWILEHGYDYLIFDYRGYGMSEGKPSPEGTVKDGKAALRWLAKHKDSAGPLFIFGQSLGGAVGLRVACELKDEIAFEKVVVDSTFHSYEKAGQKVLAKSWLTWPFQWLAHLVLSDRYAPKECISRISPRPLLVVHGTEDPTIDFTLGEKVFELAGEPKEFWRVEGGKHTDFLFRENSKFQRKFIDWLQASLQKKQETEIIDPKKVR